MAEDFLPQVKQMTDDEVFAEVAEIAEMEESALLAELSSEDSNLTRAKFINNVRSLAQSYTTAAAEQEQQSAESDEER